VAFFCFYFAKKKTPKMQCEDKGFGQWRPIHYTLEKRQSKDGFSFRAISSTVKNLLSSSLLSKNFKIKIYRTIILPVVLCGCENWSLTLREGCRLRRIFVPKRDEVTGDWRKLQMRSLMICTPHPILCG